MRILIWTHVYYPLIGGVERVTQNLAEGLTKKGHNVLVLSNSWHPFLNEYELPRKETLESGEIVRIKHFQVPSDKGLSNKVKVWYKKVLQTITFYKIKRVLHDFNPDVLNIHYPDSQLPYLSAIKSGYPVHTVVSMHGSDVYNQYYKITQGNENGYSKSVNFQNFKSALLSSEYITFCSEWLRNLAEECIEIKTERSAVIHNGVEFENDKQEPTMIHEPYLFAYGRLSHIKGFDLLVRSFENILFHYPELKLIIAGDGEEKHYILSIIEQLGLRESVVLKGFLNQEDILSYAESASVNIIPSRREAFSLSVLEAISSLRPVVATNVGGIPEAGGDLVHYAEPNVESLTKAIKKALNAPPPDKQKVQAHLANFTVEKMVDKYERVFKEVCGKD